MLTTVLPRGTKLPRGRRVPVLKLQNFEVGQAMHRPDPRRSFDAIGCGG
jgi:hypothetical protein